MVLKSGAQVGPIWKPTNQKGSSTQKKESKTTHTKNAKKWCIFPLRARLCLPQFVKRIRRNQNQATFSIPNLSQSLRSSSKPSSFIFLYTHAPLLSIICFLFWVFLLIFVEIWCFNRVISEQILSIWRICLFNGFETDLEGA